MYRKNANGWLKHINFIILDMICLQIAFVVTYFIKDGNIHLYNNFLYSKRTMEESYKKGY